MEKIDLYDKQSIIGAKIERIIKERDITKTEISNKTGVSKPTLDKLLKGNLTNRINYDKHITKILNFLDLREVDLFGAGFDNDNQIRVIRNVLQKTVVDISKTIDMSVERYTEIEEGADATLAELRNIAVALGTSVNDLLGRNYFKTQISESYLFIDEKYSPHVSGFWGHIGILMANTEEYVWYPITLKTRNYIYSILNQEWMVIPCMNNKLLLLNANNIKEILMSDFDADQPDFVNWDKAVDCGSIPQVFYEAVIDYYYDDYDSNTISNLFAEWMQNIIDTENINENYVHACELAKLFYMDGKSRYMHLDFSCEDDIVSTIKDIYEFNDGAYIQKFIPCEGCDGSEILINTNTVAMLEMPLVEVEEAIQNLYEQYKLS